MKRKFYSFPLTDYKKFKKQLLYFGIRYSNFCFLDNHDYNFNKSYECIAGVGSVKSITSNVHTGIGKLPPFLNNHGDWIFGHVGYDLKNEIEELKSQNFDGIFFPDFTFFIPEFVLILKENSVAIGVLEDIDARDIYYQIIYLEIKQTYAAAITLESRFTKAEYISTIQKIKQHIQMGDCYEICFCQEYFNENVELDSVMIYTKLNKISPNPFAAFYKFENKYLICASPERFLKKMGKEIISQPIKGTSKRRVENIRLDEQLKKQLQLNEKERAENIMIVDLVRNDLSKICEEGSVKVKEFLKIYTFPQVHQMISTISGQLKEDIPLSEIFTATFPMGSMTGAPKKRAMELIEQYERTKRGLFSGTIGYINPEGDFDFNVVIRSLLYNNENKYLSLQVGSAITHKSVAEKEYEECVLKMEAMLKTLSD